MSDQYPELLTAYKKEGTKRVAERILMVHNVLNKGMAISVVADIFQKAYNTVKNCCNRFKKRGVIGLHDAPRSGRPPKIKNETLDKYVGDTSKGIDLQTLANDLREKHGVDYSKPGMRAKAYSMNWSCKKPQPAHYRRAGMEYAVTWCYELLGWMDELEKDRFDPWALDQHLVQNDYNPRRYMWSKVGVSIWRWKYQRRSQFYLFGGFALSGQQRFRNIGKYTGANVLRFLKELHRDKGQIGLIWDRAPQHTCNDVVDYLADNASDIRVQWFPVAWPELDPVEYYWSKLERHEVMNRVFETVDERTKSVMNVVRSMKANMDIRKIMAESELVQKIPGNTMYYKLESVTEEPLTQAYIDHCKNFLA